MKKPTTLEEALIMIEQQQAEILELREKLKEIQEHLDSVVTRYLTRAQDSESELLQERNPFFWRIV